jgi:hypothetical protein
MTLTPLVLLLAKEARLSIDASLDEVHRQSGKMDSRAAWHGWLAGN